MKKTTISALFVSLVLLLSACRPHEPQYKAKLDVPLGPAPQLTFDRYEEAFFGLDTASFQQGLKSIQDQYRPFLDGDLDDPDAVGYLKDFVTDPISLALFQKVEQVFPNLDGVRPIVETAYRHFNYYYPETSLPNKVYTCVSGVNPNIPAVLLSEDGLVVSLDWYLDGDEVYDKIGMPQYRSERTALPTLARDLGELLYNLRGAQQGRRQGNLLEEMVYVGLRDYFIEAMSPSISDATLLGYTPEQLSWAEANEGNLWADMVGNQRLYESSLENYRIFLADGPFTNEYSHDAPPRLGEFIGLHIVRSYMNTHDTPLVELMQQTDLQELFQESGYKPKK